DRERLLISGSVAHFDSSVATTVAIAETLAVRYPGDPEAQNLLGQALENRGDYGPAVAAYNRAVALDSAAGAAAGPFCRLCSALGDLSRTYLWWDSLDASVRTARRNLALRPREAGGWLDLAEPLFRLGKRAEAIAALDRRESMTSPNALSRELLRRDLIRSGEFEELDRQLIADLDNPSPDVRGSSRWLLLISLRNQGRLREAKALAWDRIIPGTNRVADIETETVHQMLIAMDSGEPDVMVRGMSAAADGTLRNSLSPGTRARLATWYLTLAGTAMAAAGDTAAVRRLADSVERVGRESSFGRDPRLHHFLRGLVLQRSGRHGEAVQEFQLAVHSLSDGYTRINFEMARCLIQLGRSAEAVAVLEPALRGGVDGSNTYVSRTELHETLAQAFEQAGQRDSARIHYAAVERAWRHADPRFASRYEVAKAKSAGS
ncbi:MAG TPA: tetratricopeptide repeat protein, partial [Gemmatimonadales bacterium]|nr:tetratricopeptide repeat protein [Gemmatimonadales bacterium]